MWVTTWVTNTSTTNLMWGAGTEMKTLAVVALAAGAWWSAEGFALRPVGGTRTARSRLSMTAEAMPPPLSLSQIASKLKFEVTDIDTGA
jgi:hypothetical protein